MNNLGSAYRDSGQLDHAISMFEEAVKMQPARFDAEHPRTLSLERNLALAYDRAGRDQDAERLYRKVIAAARRREPRDQGFYADLLSQFGRCLIRQAKFAEAGTILRECLEVEMKFRPDGWTNANARSLLGEALAGQNSFQDAEPLLLDGWKGLSETRERIPVRQRDTVLRAAADRLVRLYTSWNRPVEAEKWKNK
jgi:tetratricopeptide (TPR) repeat protein